MTKHVSIAAGVLALGLGAAAATGLVAQAQPGVVDMPVRAEHRGDAEGWHGHRRSHGGARLGGELARGLFDAVDRDGDGTVTAAEIDAYRDARLTETDSDGDGALSLEEFDALYRSITRPRMVDAFQSLDADGNGIVTRAEMDTRIARLVERLDRDGDGALTLQRPGRAREAE